MFKTYTGLKGYGFSFHETDIHSQNPLQPLTFLYDLISVLIEIQLLFCLIDGGKQEEMFFWDDFWGKI